MLNPMLLELTVPAVPYGERKKVTNRVRRRLAGNDDASPGPEAARSLFGAPVVGWGEAPGSLCRAIDGSGNGGSNRGRTKGYGADGAR